MNIVINQQRILDDRSRAEDWLCRHLWDKTGVNVRAGVTTPQERIRGICELIKAKGLADEVLGHTNGKSETYKAWLRRALGVELDVPSPP